MQLPLPTITVVLALSFAASSLMFVTEAAFSSGVRNGVAISQRSPVCGGMHPPWTPLTWSRESCQFQRSIFQLTSDEVTEDHDGVDLRLHDLPDQDRRYVDASTDSAKPDVGTQRMVSATSTLELPFNAITAFEAFCDFPRQPSWSDWLKSVEYLEDESAHPTTLIRNTRWKARLFGLPYSWSSEVTEYVPGVKMGWRSISGLKTSGLIVFEPEAPVNSVGMECCSVTLTMSVQAPRAVAALFRRSGALERFFRDRILGGTLEKFCKVVYEEDVGGSA